MAGNIDAALREAEAAIRVFEAEKQTARAAAAVLLLAETTWQARRIDDARHWAERGHPDDAREAATPTHLARLLSLAATLANLRGEYAKAAAYQAEIERLDAGRKGRRGGAPARRHARRRRRQPDRGDRAGPLRNQRGAGGPGERLRDAS